MDNSKKVVRVKKQFIKDCYQSAPVDFKKMLKEDFGKSVDLSDFFEFGETYVINTFMRDKPMCIGQGLVNQQHRHKCILLNKAEFDIQFIEHEDYTQLVFTKKIK